MGHDEVSRRMQDRALAEKEAVRTTIVGGRPPGSGQAVGAVPRGLEVVLKKAAVDAAFRTDLLERRAGAAQAIGLVLTPAEQAMLRVVSSEQLAGMVAQTRVPPSAVPALMGTAAAMMLAALGLVQLTGCEREGVYSAGIRPDDKPPTTATSQPIEVAGAMADPVPVQRMMPAPGGSRPPTEAISRGVRPDVPPTTATKPATQPATQPATGPASQPAATTTSQPTTAPLPPDHFPVSKGIRPDVPPKVDPGK